MRVRRGEYGAAPENPPDIPTCEPAGNGMWVAKVGGYLDSDTADTDRSRFAYRQVAIQMTNHVSGSELKCVVISSRGNQASGPPVLVATSGRLVDTRFAGSLYSQVSSASCPRPPRGDTWGAEPRLVALNSLHTVHAPVRDQCACAHAVGADDVSRGAEQGRVCVEACEQAPSAARMLSTQYLTYTLFIVSPACTLCILPPAMWKVNTAMAASSLNSCVGQMIFPRYRLLLNSRNNGCVDSSAAKEQDTVLQPDKRRRLGKREEEWRWKTGGDLDDTRAATVQDELRRRGDWLQQVCYTLVTSTIDHYTLPANIGKVSMAQDGQVTERGRSREHMYVPLAEHWLWASHTEGTKPVKGLHWLACSLPTKANRLRSSAGPLSGFSQVPSVPYDASSRWVFSEMCRFPRPCIPALLHTHLASPLSAPETSMLRAFSTPLSHSFIL
ncbi:hypothetical protein PR048_024172 [Dryococelus australis]|uniref:Uncharacterized protein n=1 Tax=Dryococelus australis TaxID=614101 RepID=A0ABQ9GW72_9NEOP|nr:hypothetical protein PR048_024172 [Dryococelus australis]